MFWTVHWNYYLHVNSIDEWNGEVDDFENTATYNDYVAAFGRFTMVACNDVVGRCWMTVHKNDDDKEGKVMFAYSDRWEDEIIVNFG